MTTTYYMIGPSRSRAAIARLVDLVDSTRQVRCIHRWWEAIDRAPRDASDGVLREYHEAAAQADLDAMREASVVVVWADVELQRSMGAHAEIGAALALGLPIAWLDVGPGSWLDGAADGQAPDVFGALARRTAREKTSLRCSCDLAIEDGATWVERAILHAAGYSTGAGT